MEAETRMATPRQIAYIERLNTGNGMGIEKSLKELTSTEASELITELLHKVNSGQNGEEKSAISKASNQRRNDFGSGARLGMAFKCVYRKWTSNGADIFKHKDHFISAVLETYKLINDIAEKALDSQR